MYIAPPLLLLIAIALSYLVSLLFPALQLHVASFPAMGLVLIGLGVGLFVWAGSILQKHKTTLHPRGKPSSLVTIGPYKVSRNPIYLGFLLIAVGTAMLFANVLAFIGPVLFFAFVSTFVIPFEEDMLTGLFGKSYASYRTMIRRWL